MYRFAWLRIPFPFNTGMTEVEAVLNERTRPSDLNEHSVLYWRHNGTSQLFS